MSDLLNQYIIDRQGTVYIGIKNIDNRFCYYISALQRLHSSPTLTRLLQNEPCRQEQPINLLNPLKMYAKITTDNVQEVFDMMRTELQNTLPHLSENLQYGGNPDHILIVLMLPVIQIAYGIDVVRRVMQELYVNPNRLKFLLYDDTRLHNFDITTDPHANQMLKKSFGEIQTALQHDILQPSSAFQFNVSTMSIMFKDSTGMRSKYNGHAVNIILGQNEHHDFGLYILDDSVGISSFTDFLQNHRERIGYWELKDSTDEVLQMIEQVPGINVDKRLHRDVINIAEVSGVMSGGHNESQNTIRPKDDSYVEEVVNACEWYPFTAVKDRVVNETAPVQEIYGDLGGTISGTTSTPIPTSVPQPSLMTIAGGAHISSVPWHLKIYNQLFTTINKLLLALILILVIIIVVIICVQRYNLKKHNRKIEMYKSKYTELTKKNDELSKRLVKPKPEVAVVLNNPKSDIKPETFKFPQPIGRMNLRYSLK